MIANKICNLPACSRRQQHKPKHPLIEHHTPLKIAKGTHERCLMHGKGSHTFRFKLFGCNIRFTTAKTFAQMRSLFPTHPEHIRNTKVSDLQDIVHIEQQILRLDISMCDSHRMKVSDTSDHLIKVGPDLSFCHATFFDGAI